MLPQSESHVQRSSAPQETPGIQRILWIQAGYRLQLTGLGDFTDNPEGLLGPFPAFRSGRTYLRQHSAGCERKSVREETAENQHS